jgi:toxin YoeB
MIYKVELSLQAKQDVEHLRRTGDRQALKKLDALLDELEEHPRTGTGKPEPLRGDRAGQWSRRITDRHRLVYIIDDDRIVVLVLAAVGHYD